LKSLDKSHNIFIVMYCCMTCEKNHHTHEQTNKNLNNSPKKKNNDVVDRFLSVLWRREVDWKLTFK